jgi:hypothetical protein
MQKWHWAEGDTCGKVSMGTQPGAPVARCLLDQCKSGIGQRATPVARCLWDTAGSTSGEVFIGMVGLGQGVFWLH